MSKKASAILLAGASFFGACSVSEKVPEAPLPYNPRVVEAMIRNDGFRVEAEDIHYDRVNLTKPEEIGVVLGTLGVSDSCEIKNVRTIVVVNDEGETSIPYGYAVYNGPEGDGDVITPFNSLEELQKITGAQDPCPTLRERHINAVTIDKA